MVSSRYDVLLGMPLYVANNPEIDYTNWVMKLGSDAVPVYSHEEKSVPRVEVTNLRVESFRIMVQRKGNRNDFQVFQMIQVNSFLKSTSNGSGSSKVEQLLKKCDEVFTEELPDRLPPKRAVDHQIETDMDSKPLHRPLFQLSTAELEAAKEYVETLLKKRKIRPGKSPYGASLFFGVRRAGLRGGLQLAVHGVRELVQAAPVRDADQERGEQLFNVWEYALVGPYQGAVGQRAVRQQLDDDRARVRPVALQRDVVD